MIAPINKNNSAVLIGRDGEASVLSLLLPTFLHQSEGVGSTL